MGNKKCKDIKKEKKVEPKDSHKYQCKKCGLTAKKDKKLCKPEPIK